MKISKSNEKQIDECRTKLDAARDALYKAADDYNEKIGAAYADLSKAVEAYNAVVSDAKSVVDDIAGELRGEFDEKSEKWQDSDKGQEAQALVGEWEEFTLDEFEMPDEPDNFDADSAVGSEAFENLRTDSE